MAEEAVQQEEAVEAFAVESSAPYSMQLCSSMRRNSSVEEDDELNMRVAEEAKASSLDFFFQKASRCIDYCRP